jgi:predicted O-methyltransferase YrrM
MSAAGYLPLVKQFIFEHVPQDKVPSVLEVGIDRGVMMIPLVVFLARTRQQFTFVGVDILIQEQVQLVLANLDLQQHQQAFIVKGNSLEVLPKMVEQQMKFDVLLLDGDHNYHTVSEEMKHLEALTNPGSIVICDDYDGRWSDRDLWYSERPGYEDVKLATPKVDTEKHGVKAAVDEWLESHPEWQKVQPMKGEPVLLMRKVA